MNLETAGTPCPKAEPRPKKVFKPLKRTPLKVKPQSVDPAWKKSGNFYVLKPMSAKRAKLEKEKLAMYAAENETRPMFCAGCGTSQNISRSHRISQRFRDWISDPENIDYLCMGGCHENFEAGYMWRLDNGSEILDWLKKTSWSHYAAKVRQMEDRIYENSLILDEMASWVQNHINSL